MTLPGSEVYRDASTGIWYSYAQGSWHYSVDTCQSWVDVNMLEIRVVEGTGTVDTFGAQQWSHTNGAQLQFFDTRYAQSGWHNMTEFVVEYYDGVGYDGEPLKVVDAFVTTEQSESTVWLNHLTPTGGTPESPPPDATITEWDTYVYGQWDNKLLASWIVPNPVQNSISTILAASLSPGAATASAGTPAGPLTVLFQGDMFPWPWEPMVDDANQCMIPGGVYVKYQWQDFSLKRLVDVAEVISEVEGEKIGTLAMIEHCNVNLLRIGCTTLSAPLFYSRGYDELFQELGGVLAPGAQIQFFGCNVAGPNPYDPAANWANVQNKVAWSNEYQAMEARSMLSAIAQSAGATVFASSDFSGSSKPFYDPITGKVLKVTPLDMALEFVVGPDGYQIPWSSTKPGGAHEMHAIWDTAIWSPDPRTADTGGPFQYSPITSQTSIPTFGEEDNRYWPSTLQGLWKLVYS